jgi:hypothetical protein
MYGLVPLVLVYVVLSLLQDFRAKSKQNTA